MLNWKYGIVNLIISLHKYTGILIPLPQEQNNQQI
jgi:hypothetical protein